MSISAATHAVRTSQILRLSLLGVLTLVLLIPVSMIRGLVDERQQRHEAATVEVSSKWGNRQFITGPALVLPYTFRWTETSNTGQETARTEVRNAIFLPRQLRASGRVNAESRSRGIFIVPVYTATLSIEGEFGRPNLSELSIDPANVLWNRAHLAMGISDVRAIREQPALNWNGSETGFFPGTGRFAHVDAGIHAPVTVNPADSAIKFSFPLSLNGSLGLYLSPFAEETVVQMTSNSAYPNFQGSSLPADRTVTDSGFDATWRVSYLGRNYPQVWTSGQDMRKVIEDSRFGVELTEPVDQYRMADRSVKYAGLFILLTFTCVWLVEVLAGVRVHPIQYLMVGAALCVFYLLELSLSEHIRFPLAYGVACLSIVGMVSAYSCIIFRRGGRASVVSAGVSLLYVYLFVLLTNEDAALLVGSIGLFVILAAIMFVTRGVDWYAGRRSTAMPEA